ncbi:MAG: cupin domain-containing protein [Acidimicrobiales bacterium]
MLSAAKPPTGSDGDLSAHAPNALERCVGDADPFLAEYFGRRPFLRHGDVEAYDDLLSLETADQLLTGAGLRTPAVRLVRDGTRVPPTQYTVAARIGGVPMPGILDPRRVLAEFDAGATVVLQGMHRYWYPLRRFCRELELTIGHPCQVNAYLTPAGAQGLAVHADSHDVFVLQAFGRKRWEVRSGDDDDEPWDVLLEPGDALYLPVGTRHAARTQDELSGHLTIGVLATTWRTLLERVLERLVDDAAFDAPLPPAWHAEAANTSRAVREQLDALADRLAKADPLGITEDAIDEFHRGRYPLLAGSFADRARLRDVTDATVVRLRQGVVAERRRHRDRLALLIGDRELRMPVWVEAAVSVLTDGDDHRLSEAAPHLDPESRLVLGRRLIREGVLEVRG